MKVKAIITGSTGMVGEGVLITALQSPDVEKVIVINRKPCGYVHEKLTEIIHEDFNYIATITDRLAGFNACFFCLGISSVGVDSEEYFDITYTLTMRFALELAKTNPELVFCYVSGAGTDSSEIGLSRWARVKGKTENDLMRQSFRSVYAFRPGLMEPVDGQKNVHRYYRRMAFLMPLFRKLGPPLYCKLSDLGTAMIKTVTKGYHKRVLKTKDIVALAGNDK